MLAKKVLLLLLPKTPAKRLLGLQRRLVRLLPRRLWSGQTLLLQKPIRIGLCGMLLLLVTVCGLVRCRLRQRLLRATPSKSLRSPCRSTSRQGITPHGSYSSRRFYRTVSKTLIRFIVRPIFGLLVVLLLVLVSEHPLSYMVLLRFV
jgi:hypothetical protein